MATIAVLGSGNMGITRAPAWAAAGHDPAIASLNPAKLALARSRAVQVRRTAEGPESAICSRAGHR
jgi:predicted dinucleotide-binding enzyme